MRTEQATAFMAQLEKLCDDYGVYCKLELNKRPKLQHIKAVINVKVDVNAELHKTLTFAVQ